MTSRAAHSLDDAFTATYDKRKYAILLAGAVVFVGVGFALLQKPGLSQKFAVAACTGFFALGALAFLARLFHYGVVLTIDRSGVFDRRVTDCPVPWEAIAHIRRSSILNHPFYVLSLSRPVTDFTTSPLKRLLLSLNSIYTDGGLYLMPSDLDVVLGDIEYEIRRRLPVDRDAATVPRT